MKHLFLNTLVLMLSFSANAAANFYDLRMEYKINGKVVSTPQLIIEEGKLGSISTGNDSLQNFIEVVATEGENNAIMMAFALGTTGPDGQKKILGRPRIHAIENEAATITQIDENGKSSITISVVATRKKSQ